MKLTQTIGIASALLLAAGCAHEERSVQTDEGVSPGYSSYSAQSGYDPQNKSSSPSSGSAGRTYSSGILQGKPARSDNSIVAQVREALQRDPEIAFVVPNIQITAANGAIILTGSVQSEEQKRQIMAKALEVNGVVAVNNQLSVMSGPDGGQGAGSQLNPTSNSGADRLYKDAANGPDNSTNNVLNPTSRANGPAQLYQESNQGGNKNLNNLNSNTNNNQQMP